MRTAATSPRGPYRTGVKRRQQIVDAATVAFARRGYAGASLRQIADVVGVTVAGLLRHFSSKEELLEAVLDRWSDDTDRLVYDHEAGLAWFLQFPQLMLYHEDHPGLIELYLTLCGESSDPAHPARPWIARRYERIIADGMHHLRLAREAGDIRSMHDAELERELRALYALMDGLELQWISNPDLDLAATFEPIFHAILDRWRGEPSSPPGRRPSRAGSARR